MAKVAPIKILILAVNANKANFAREILNNMGACSCWSFLGKGTNVGVMDVLGLNNPEKMVFICVVPSKSSTQILTALCKDLELYKEKNGMALTIPIGAISRDALNEFLGLQKQNEQELKQEENYKDAKVEKEGQENLTKEEAK